MLPKRCERGYGVWVRKDSIVYNLWKDTKVVCVASTVHTGNSRIVHDTQKSILSIKKS